MQPSHASLKTLLLIELGFQVSNIPAGKSVKLELNRHVFINTDPLLTSIFGKEVKSFPRQVYAKLVAELRSNNGNEVNEASCQALAILTLDAAVPSFAPAGNDAREVQDFHADAKLVPVLKSKAGKLVRPLDCHALVKFTLVALVPSFAPAGNELRVETEFHAFEKFVPLLMSSAGKLAKRVS